MPGEDARITDFLDDGAQDAKPPADGDDDVSSSDAGDEAVASPDDGDEAVASPDDGAGDATSPDDVDDEPPSAASRDEGADPDTPPASATPAGQRTVQPAVSTSEWRDGGVACENCGTTAARRWRDGDALVCVDCKEW